MQLDKVHSVCFFFFFYSQKGGLLLLPEYEAVQSRLGLLGFGILAEPVAVPQQAERLCRWEAV